jgi:hypothetical protein
LLFQFGEGKTDVGISITKNYYCSAVYNALSIQTSVPEGTRNRPDLLLLISLVLLILLYPAMDHSDFRRFILNALMFAPVIIGTVRLAETRDWAWPAMGLMLGVLVFTIASTVSDNRATAAIKWGLLAAFFALTVIKLFSYLRNSVTVGQAHLATAISIYLLLGMLWFAVYSAIDAISPNSISHSSTASTERSSELLYFSLITLTTVGYGDVLPMQGEVRILAALEGLTGVLYVAITVAVLVGAYRPPRP